MQVLDDFMNTVLRLRRYAAQHNLPMPGLILSSEWNDFITYHKREVYIFDTPKPPSVYGLPIKWVKNIEKATRENED